MEIEFGRIYWGNSEIACYVKYLAICKYFNSDKKIYLFYCGEKYEVVEGSLWDCIEMCIASSSHSGQIRWKK